MENKTILIFVVLLTLFSCFSIAENILSTSPADSFVLLQAGENTIRGNLVSFNQTMILENVTKYASSTCTYAFIYNITAVGVASGGFGVANASFVGNDAWMNVTLIQNHTYAIGCGVDGNGGLYDFYGDATTTLPKHETYLTWNSTGGFWRNNAEPKQISAVASAGYNIKYLGTRTSGSSGVNFTISIKNLQNTSTIGTANAYINSFVFSTSTGVITTSFLINSSAIYNITVESDGYLNRTYLNYNLSQNLEANLYQTIIHLNATEAITSNQIYGGNYSTTWMNGNPIYGNTGSITITFNKSSDYLPKIKTITATYGLMNYTISGVGNTQLNITAKYLSNSSSIGSFSILLWLANSSYVYNETVSTTTAVATFTLLRPYRYNLTFSADGYQSIQGQVNLTAHPTTYEFLVYTTNSFNVTFYDEITGDQINKNVSVEFIGNIISYNYTAWGGRLYADLLTPQNYTIRYHHADYGRIRNYLLTLENNSHNDLIFYMIPKSNSTEITTTLYDEGVLNVVEDAVIYLQRFFVDDNTYKTVAMYKTDVGGNAYFDVDKGNELYKFVIDYPWKTTRETTIPQYLYSTTINLYISLQSTMGGDFYDQMGISSVLSYDNSTGTNKFIVTWNDPDLVGDNFCLYVKRNGAYDSEIINSTCSTSHSGTLEITGLIQDGINYGVFTATMGGEEITLKSVWKDFVDQGLGSSRFGLFAAALIFITAVFVMSIHIYSLLFGSFSLVFIKLLGLIDPISWPVIIGVIGAAIILAIFIEAFKK